MPSGLDKLFEKGKAKLHEYTSPSHSQHPSQGYPNQQQQYPGGQYQQQNYPPQQYDTPPPGQQYPPYQYNPPQNQYQRYQPPPGQWGPPPQQQPLSPPPVPQHSKPHSPQPPPVPLNRPPSQSNPGSNAGYGGGHERIYWQPPLWPTTQVSDNFRHELGAHGWGNNEAQNYVADPANSFHTPDGRLVVRAISHNGSYTSARLTSHQTLSRARGYLTVTVQAPCAEGIWPAFWMLPKDPFQWPNDGEVDIVETWNGDCQNHSCLHWGHYNGEDWNKHRVHETHIPSFSSQPHTFGFAWSEEAPGPQGRGKMIWYIDGRPVMKGHIPEGTRRMEEYRLLINVAMGGTVCQGKLPRDGAYDFVVWDLKMCEEPLGGWAEFERAWANAQEGHAM